MTDKKKLTVEKTKIKQWAIEFFNELKEIAENSHREIAEPYYDMGEELKGWSEEQIVAICDIAIDSLQSE